MGAVEATENRLMALHGHTLDNNIFLPIRTPATVRIRTI